jgi:hypothetical protein
MQSSTDTFAELPVQLTISVQATRFEVNDALLSALRQPGN